MGGDFGGEDLNGPLETRAERRSRPRQVVCCRDGGDSKGFTLEDRRES